MTFSFSITIIFWLFLIFWIQIPGMLFGELLLPRRLNIQTRLLAGFFIGFIYLATVYLIESITGINGLIMVAGPIASLISIYRYFKKGRPSLYNAGEHFSWVGLIIFGFIFIASTLNFQLKFIGALGGQTTQVYHDFLFHTGNIVSLSRSFPCYDIRIDGLEFYYHYFYELIFAMCKHIFKMDAFRLYMNGNAIICAWPLTLSLMIIGNRLKGAMPVKSRNYFFYCFGTLVSCICLLPLNVVGGRFPISWMDNHFFGNGNAMGLAMSLSILVISFLAEIWYDKFSVKNMITMYLLTAAATGFKGTTGVLIVGISWAVFLVENAISKRVHIYRIFYMLSMTLGFALTYILVTAGLNSSGANNRAMEISVQGTLDSSRVGQIFSKLGLDYMAFPWVIIAVALCAVCIVGPMILPFAAFTISKFKTLINDKVIGNIFDWFVIGSCIMGVIGFCFISVPGLSQGYFVITNAAFIFYGAFKYVLEHKKSVIAYITNIFFAIGIIFLVADLAYFGYDDYKQNKVYETEAGDRADLVSSDLLDAYLWLRDNTSEDSVVAVDRFSEELDYRSIYFYCSAFSERQCYIEGYDYSDITEKQVDAKLSINESFFGARGDEAEIALELSGIDYIVVTEMEHPDYVPWDKKLKLVYTNDEVSIYRFFADGGINAVE